MKKRARHFIYTWVLVCTVLTVAAAAFNAITDPYLVVGMPRIAGFNAHKPAIDRKDRLIKAYDVLRAQPNTLILGSSGADLGLDPQSPAWPVQNRPVYNLALAGATSPYTLYRYLQHVQSQRHISLVVVGLEFDAFVKFDSALSREEEARLMVYGSGNVNVHQRRQQIRDLVTATLSLDALVDSVSTLVANRQGASSDLVSGGWEWRSIKHSTREFGAYPLFFGLNRLAMRWLPGREADPLVMSRMRELLDLCESQGTSVILVISPSHADFLEILDLTGHWQAFEDRKRELVALTAEYSKPSGRSGVQLWDFSGYSAYSTETVRADGRALRWFWDTGHYTRALGDMVVKRVLGNGDPHFGVLLTVDNLETHLADIREQRRHYRTHHSADVRRVHDLYNATIRPPLHLTSQVR